MFLPAVQFAPFADGELPLASASGFYSPTVARLPTGSAANELVLPVLRVPDGTPGRCNFVRRPGAPQLTITTADWRLAWFLAGDGNAPDLFVDQPFKSGVPNFIDNLSHDSAKRLPTDRRVVIALHTRNGMEECKQWLRIGLRERVAEYEK